MLDTSPASASACTGSTIDQVLPGLREPRRLAAGGDAQLLDGIGLDRRERLLRRVLRRRRLLRLEVVDVADEPAQDGDEGDRRNQPLHALAPPPPGVEAAAEHRDRHDEHREAPARCTSWRLSIVSRRSAGSRGRIEIRFSCCASQLTVFMNRLTLPGTPASWLVTNSESPIAAMRVSGGAGLAVSPAAAARGRRLGGLDRDRHRGADRHRAEDVAGGFVGRRQRVGIELAQVGLGPAVGPGLHERLRGVAVAPRAVGLDGPHQREHGQQTEAVGDRVRRGRAGRPRA